MRPRRDQMHMKSAVLLVHFGVSLPDVRKKTIDRLEQLVRAHHPEQTVCSAYTSEMIRRKLARQGIEIPNTDLALQQLADTGVTAVVIQPTHLIAGDEYHKMLDQIEAHRGRFESIRVGRPLMYAPEDYRRMADVLNAAYPCAADAALVLMGHGTGHAINAAYPALCYEFAHRGYEHIFLGTVEGYPDLDDVMQDLSRRAVQTVRLAPLLFVAGDHAQNDMAGDEPDSWKSRLTAAGYRVEPLVIGLGEIEAVQMMYLDHLDAVL